MVRIQLLQTGADERFGNLSMGAFGVLVTRLDAVWPVEEPPDVNALTVVSPRRAAQSITQLPGEECSACLRKSLGQTVVGRGWPAVGCPPRR